MRYTWKRLQDEVGRWADKNFPTSPPKHALYGLMEELGELTHSHLKMEQGIRGPAEKHVAAGKDAVGDFLVFLMHFFHQAKWDATEVLKTKDPEEFQKTYTNPEGSDPLFACLNPLSCLVLVDLADDVRSDVAKAMALATVGCLAGYCTSKDWSMQTIIDEVWSVVQKRDWTKNKETGVGEVAMAVANLEPIKKMELTTAKPMTTQEVGAHLDSPPGPVLYKPGKTKGE